MTGLHQLNLDDPYLALQLAGTVAFAVSGAAVAVRAGMDWLGIAVLAVVTAVGGGTLRDLLLGRLPVGWITDPWPVWVALAGTNGAQRRFATERGGRCTCCCRCVAWVACIPSSHRFRRGQWPPILELRCAWLRVHACGRCS